MTVALTAGSQDLALVCSLAGTTQYVQRKHRMGAGWAHLCFTGCDFRQVAAPLWVSSKPLPKYKYPISRIGLTLPEYIRTNLKEGNRSSWSLY